MTTPTLLPELLAVQRIGAHEEQVRLHLHVPDTLLHFSGHFPGLPILPGVVQIDWAVRYARGYFPISDSFTALEKIKFHALVLPGATLALVLKWDSSRARLEFAYTTTKGKHSSGNIVFRRAV